MTTNDAFDKIEARVLALLPISEVIRFDADEVLAFDLELLREDQMNVLVGFITNRDQVAAAMPSREHVEMRMSVSLALTYSAVKQTITSFIQQMNDYQDVLVRRLGNDADKSAGTAQWWYAQGFNSVNVQNPVSLMSEVLLVRRIPLIVTYQTTTPTL